MSKLKNKYVLIILGFYIFWLGILPFVLSETAKILCRNISHNSNYEIRLEKPATKLYLVPCIKFKFNKITILSKINSSKIELDNFKIKLRLLPLLSGKIHINYVEMTNLNGEIRLNKKIEFDKNFFNELKNQSIIVDSLKADKFALKLLSNDEKTPIEYKGEDFIFKNKNRYLITNLKSCLKTSDKSSNITINLFIPKNNDINKTHFDVSVQNIDIAPLGIYFKNFLPEELKELRGTVNINAKKETLTTELKNVAAIMKDNNNSILLPSEITVKSSFNIKTKEITINSAEINSKNINLIIKGKIRDYFGKTMPTLDLNIAVNKSKVEDFINMLPAFRIEDIDTFALKKYKFYGDVIGNMSIKGRLPEPELYGNIFVDNGILTKPIPNTTKGASIKVKLTGRYISYDVYVPAGFSQKVWVKGTQELYNIKYADLTVKSTEDVDLQQAEIVVNPLHEIFNFVIGPVPILDVYGTGNIDIIVKGNRKYPHVWGGLNFKNADVNFIEIPDLKLKGANATLTFNDQNAVFKTQKGQVNGKDFSINGVCDLSGKFDFDVVSQNQPTLALYTAILTSTMIPDVKKMLPKLDKIEGVTDINLKIYGAIKDVKNLAFNKNAFSKGEIRVKDNNILMQGVGITKANATIKIDNTNAAANITAMVGSSQLKINGKVKNDFADIDINIPKFNPNFLLQYKGNTKQYLPYVSVIAKYKGNIENIEYDKLNFNSKIIASGAESNLKFNSGTINLSNNKLTIKNLDGYISNVKNSFKADLKINDVFSSKPVVNGGVYVKTPDLSILNEIFAQRILPEVLQKKLKDFEFKKGAVNISLRFNDNKINTDSDLSNISFNYLPLDMPIDILNGNITVRNNNLFLHKINILADNMPILVDGNVRDIFDKQIFDIYLNSKPQQSFIDKYVNKNRIYPVKIKGDIVYSAVLKGVSNNFDLKATLDMNKESVIYYRGATIGDLENALVISLDTHINNGKYLKVREFLSDKLINSQNTRQTRLNMIKARGDISFINDDLYFKDFRVKTSNPTDAKIFNIIFGKPNIKQGQFTSDLKFNGRMSDPKIIGDFHIFETDIPFLDTIMKNIEISFKERNIEISSKGEIMGNDISVNGILRNKLTPPYYIESAAAYTKDMNFDRLVNKLKASGMDNNAGTSNFDNFNIEDVIINKLLLKADSLQFRNIHASNFEAETSLNEKRVFEMKNFLFNIAQGELKGSYKYDFKNNNMAIKLDAEDINANDMTWALFDLNNQIYGDMTGTTKLTCNGTNFNTCMQTMNGNTIFNVKDGRMPKLGSLEYLLKAGNIVKSGITGFSLNNVIEIITPLKTGEFTDIFGAITIKDGIANNIEITTQGKNLNLFISGNYNLSTSNAEMEVLGFLSKKITTMLGPIGNVSVNTLFNLIPGVDLKKDSSIIKNINKIPGIELSDNMYRKFIAKIKGNINGEDYVSSFQWIN